MRFLLAFIFLFSQTTFGQTVGKNIEFNSVTGSDYFTNYVISPDARKNASNTTTSSATVTRDTTAANQINGVASYSVDTSATSGYVEFTLGTVYEPAISGNCEFKGVFKGDGTLYSAQIVDGSGNLLNSAVFTNETNYRPFSVVYPCAASGSRKVRITQTTAGTSPAINVGKLYYGQITNLQAGVPNNMFSAKISSTGVVSSENEDWINGNCTMSGAGSATGTCVFTTSKFTVAPTCNITPANSAANIHASLFTNSPTTAQFQYFTDVTTTGTATASDVDVVCTRPSTDFIQPAITAAQWDKDWTSFSGSVTNLTLNATGKVDPVSVWKKDGDTIRVRYSFVNGSGGNASGGNLIFTLPSGLTIDTSKLGNINAQVGTANVYGVTPGVSNQYDRLYGMQINGTGGVSISKPTTGGFISGTDVLASAQVNVEFDVPIVGWTTSQKAPQLLGSVTSNAASALRMEYLAVESDCTTSPCTIARQSGAFTSVTRSTTGTYSVNYPAGTWSASPICLFTSNNPEQQWGAYPTSTSFVIVMKNSSGTLSDGGFHTYCIGPR